ncbi:MAG: cupin domain-containing protein [Acidobacteria bacterium]|nr:cupin domain-containing protein [Acidobacteriota bacterium]
MSDHDAVDRSGDPGVARSAVGSDDLATLFAAEQDTPYAAWVRAEGLEILGSRHIPDLHTVELKPWPRRGGLGVFLNHDESRTSSDSYVCEIPPGKELAPQRQMYEEMIYVLDGRGSTMVWNDAGQRGMFEWRAGAVFAIPLNAWHQHFNGSGVEPARFVSVTNAPAIINTFDDLDFVFKTPYDFTRRFHGESAYFTGGGARHGLCLDANVVPDAMSLPLVPLAEHGGIDGHLRLRMAGGHMSGHLSQFPSATYTKAHTQGPGAHVIMLAGEGYTLVWPKGEAQQQYNWTPGTMIVPPSQCYQQYFNTGATPARYLVLKTESVAIRNAQGVPRSWIAERLGGDQINYADESPSVRQRFAAVLAERGLTSKMDEAYAMELSSGDRDRQSLLAPVGEQGGSE